MTFDAGDRLRHLTVPSTDLDAVPSDPDPLGPARAAWEAGPVRLHVVHRRDGSASTLRIAAGRAGLVVAGEPDPAGGVAVEVHPEPGALARVLAEAVGIDQVGPPPLPPSGPVAGPDLVDRLRRTPGLDVHWVRLLRGEGWHPALGAVTATDRGWSLVAADGDGRLTLEPAEAEELWTRLCRLTAVVLRQIEEATGP